MNIIFTILLIVLGANTLYLFIFSVAACFKDPANETGSIALWRLKTLVVFPVYKDDEVILQSVKAFMQQHYSLDRLKVYVIADELREETMALLRQYGANVCELPRSEKRNKAHAINTLLAQLRESFDVCVVMDADNTVERDFVARINHYFLKGVKTLQARRIAKNNDNDLSRLDTYSEIINNHIFRKGQRALGFSSSLIGSGMAFDFILFKDVMKGMDVYSGFDKELELRLLEREVLIEYAEDIIVRDEKVAQHDVFVNQRRRWIYAQLHFLRMNFSCAIYHTFVKPNFDYVNKVTQFILFPRIIALGICALLLPASLFFGFKLFVATAFIAFVMMASLLLPLRAKLTGTQIWTTMIMLPLAFINMMYAAITSGKAAGKFLHTPHNPR